MSDFTSLSLFSRQMLMLQQLCQHKKTIFLGTVMRRYRCPICDFQSYYATYFETEVRWTYSPSNGCRDNLKHSHFGEVLNKLEVKRIAKAFKGRSQWKKE